MRTACCGSIANRHASTFETASVPVFVNGGGKLIGVTSWMFVQHESAFILSMQICSHAHGLHTCKTIMPHIHTCNKPRRAVISILRHHCAIVVAYQDIAVVGFLN